MSTKLPEAPELRDAADPVIDAFDTVCDQLSGFDPRVSTEWVDGCFTALIAGPRAVTPEEWLPAMLGEAFERAFADPPSAEQALRALMDRWHQIAHELDAQALVDQADSLRLAPLLIDWDDSIRREAVSQGLISAERVEEELAIGAVWAVGFLDAVRAFANEWQAERIQADDRAWLDLGLATVRALTLPAAELAAFMAAQYPDQTLSRDELVDEACFAVQDLRMFWIDNAPKPATRRAEQKPGRNNPCPCGSGKKYKKCHGLV
jgi:uncharacterized protein